MVRIKWMKRLQKFAWEAARAGDWFAFNRFVEEHRLLLEQEQACGDCNCGC